MKNIFKTLAITVVLILSVVTNANAQKIGHINLDSLITLMPELKTAEESVQQYAQQLEKQITDMQAELQTKYAQYQANLKDLAEIVRASKEKEINDLNQRIQDFQQQAQIDYQKKSADLTKPVYEKAKAAINQIAKENHYKYILDTSTGVVLYFEASDDVFSLVAAKLGVVSKPLPAVKK